MAEHNQTGAWGEKAVADYLTARGWAIRHCNWRTGHLEIDIVASRGDEIAFVEVKTRVTDFNDPLQAITRRKMTLLGRAASAYMQQFDLPLRPRFDVAAVTGTEAAPAIDYYDDAFFPPMKSY